MRLLRRLLFAQSQEPCLFVLMTYGLWVGTAVLIVRRIVRD